MASDPLNTLIYATAFSSAAIVVVLLSRGAVRRSFGAAAAYRLWLMAPAAALAALLPARTIIAAPELAAVSWDATPAPGAVAPFEPVVVGLGPVFVDWQTVPLLVWAAGAVLFALLLLLGQARTVARFGRLTPGQVQGTRVWRMQAAGAGPAVIGVFRPRIVTPADFEARFTPEEQALVLAHERTHLAVADPLVNAAIALLRCLSWFNPLVHLAATEARVDQELACDAAVVASHPDRVRPYAEALLKTQLSGRALPLGCYWPVRSTNALRARIEMLGREAPGRALRIAGLSLVAGLVLTAGAVAWAALPAKMVQPPAAAAHAEPGSPHVRLLPIPNEAEIARLHAQMVANNPDRRTKAGAPSRALVLLSGYWGELYGAAARLNLPDDMAIEIRQSVTLADGASLSGGLVRIGGQGAFIIQGRDTWRHDRFSGDISAEVAPDGRIALRQLMVVDGRPMLAELSVASGAETVVALPGGGTLRLRPVLRPATAEELASIPAAPRRVALTNAEQAPSRPTEPPKSELETAVARGDLRQVALLGGTPADLVTALLADPNYVGARDLLPETAFIENLDGRIALTYRGADGTGHIISPPSLRGVPPPATAPHTTQTYIGEGEEALARAREMVRQMNGGS